eukprot:6046308-Prymnesium_polylepis.4
MVDPMPPLMRASTSPPVRSASITLASVPLNPNELTFPVMAVEGAGRTNPTWVMSAQLPPANELPTWGLRTRR